MVRAIAGLKLGEKRLKVHFGGLARLPSSGNPLEFGLHSALRHDEVGQDRRPFIYDWVAKLLHGGGGPAPDTMSVNLLVRLLRGAVALGGDQRKMLASLGLDEASLRNPLSRLSSALALRFLHMIEAHFGDPAVFLRIGEVASMQNFSDLGYATRLEANLASVIQANVDLQILRQTMFHTELDIGARPPSLVWHCHPDLTEAYAPFVEFSVATYARLSRQILAEPPLLQTLEFRHKPRFSIARYEAAFGCPVRFSRPVTRMEIAARQLFRPSPYANPQLLEAASARFRQPVEWMTGGQVHLANSYFYLSHALDKSPPVLELMAASFGMTERTLRRRLVDEGMPFRDILDLVRKDAAALYFLEGKRTLSEIALLLGYGELSAFTRAYKRWHDIPPSKR